MRVTPLGLCLRVILNENPLNLEKTTFSGLSLLLLIYGSFVHKLTSAVTVFWKYEFLKRPCILRPSPETLSLDLLNLLSIYFT